MNYNDYNRCCDVIQPIPKGLLVILVSSVPKARVNKSNKIFNRLLQHICQGGLQESNNPRRKN